MADDNKIYFDWQMRTQDYIMKQPDFWKQTLMRDKIYDMVTDKYGSGIPIQAAGRHREYNRFMEAKHHLVYITLKLINENSPKDIGDIVGVVWEGTD